MIDKTLDTQELNLFKQVDSFVVEHRHHNIAKQKIIEAIELDPFSSEPTFVFLTGATGSGKTTLLQSIKRSFKDYETEIGIMRPFVDVIVPSKPTIKSLLQNILLVLGDPNWERGTKEALEIRARDQIAKRKSIIISLDELQHIVDQGTQKFAWEVTDFLKKFMDTTGIVLITSGLDNAERIIKLNPQLARRVSLDIELKPYKWTEHKDMAKDMDRVEFIKIIQAYWSSVPYHHPVINEKVVSRLYGVTHGYVGLLVKIMRRAVLISLKDNKNSLTQALINQAIDESLGRRLQSAIEMNSLENSNTTSSGIALR